MERKYKYKIAQPGNFARRLRADQVTAPTCSTHTARVWPRGGGGRKELAYEVIRISQIRMSGDPPVFLTLSVVCMHEFSIARHYLSYDRDQF